jgi:tetratricopeptide (TPR) repeat protein
METYHGRYEETSQDFWGWQWGARNLIDRFRDVEDEYDQLVMDSTFNAPEIFPLFYAPNDCEKCIIGHWDKYTPGTSQLFGLRAETAWMTFEYDVKGQVYYPTGQLAFVFVEINGLHNTVPGMLPMAPNATASDFDGVQGDVVNALAMFNQANGAWEAIDVQTALDRYNAALGSAPMFAPAYYNRGNVFAAFGMLESAISDYGVVLQYDGSYNAAQANMGNAYLLLGRYEDAKTALDAVIARDQTLAPAFAARGVASHGLGQDQEAINDLDAAIRLDPNFAIAYARRGGVLHDLGNDEAAVADFTRAMELDPDLADAYTGRANSYLTRQDYPLAMADLNRAVELDRDNGTAYGRRGVAAIYTGDLERAATDLAKAVELDRMYARASANAHNPYWKVQDPAELAAQLEMALGLVEDSSIRERLESLLAYFRARALQ